jgi:predicted nucleic-acid-binding Zn-ribbon protein
MVNKYNVVYAGLQDGISAEEFINKFCSKFGIAEAKAQQIVASTSQVVVKKNLEVDKAQQYATAFEACGMVVHLEEIIIEAAPEPIPEVADPTGLSLEPLASEVEEEEAVATCPKCGSEKINNDECLDCGIYVSRYLESRENNTVHIEKEDNPYATPEAPLEISTVSKEGQGSLEGGLNGDYDFTLSEIFSESWERTKGIKGTIWLSFVFYIVVAIGVNFVLSLLIGLVVDVDSLMQQGRMSEAMIWGIIPSLISIPLLYPVVAGIILIGIQRSVDADSTAISVFGHYKKTIPLSLLTLLTGFLSMLGSMLFLLPGIYLMVGYMMAMSLMIDRDMGVWQAMETSRKAVTKHWFKLFGLYLVLWLVMMLASIPLMLGLIWMIPMSVVLHGVVYKHMFGVESV